MPLDWLVAVGGCSELHIIIEVNIGSGLGGGTVSRIRTAVINI